MTKFVFALIVAFLSFAAYSQEIKKENLSKQSSTYWDFNKTQIQSKGKYYVDELGQTNEKHGKWQYFDRLGELEEERNYYRDMLYGEVILYYPNGKKRQQGYFKYDKQDSVYREWYETGNLKMEGTYINGVEIGHWKHYYVDGTLKSVEEIKGEDRYVWEFYLRDSLHTQLIKEGNGELVSYFTTGQVKEWYNYKNGLKDGPFEEFSIYGYTVLKGNFEEGLKSGKWEYAYYTGDIEKISNYKKGVLEGPYEYFYDNGKTNVKGQYKEGKKHGEWTWYTNQGNRDMQGGFKNDLQEGDWTYWYPSGEVSYTAKFKEGLKTGQWTYFYKNGKKFKEGTFANDEKNGKWKTWYEDETLLMEGNYLNGKEQGEWLNYWESGELKNKGNFSKGLLNGEWKSYYPNGKPKLEGKYQDEMKVGGWTEYFENGKVKDVQTYKLFKKKSKLDFAPLMKGHVIMESKLHGHSESYSGADYRLTEEGDYKEGLKHGEWIAYHPGGKNPAVVTSYKDGKLDGSMKTYSRRGKLLQETEYKDGLKHGKFVIYDSRGKVVKEMRFSEGMQIIEGSAGGGGSFTPGR